MLNSGYAWQCISIAPCNNSSARFRSIIYSPFASKSDRMTGDKSQRNSGNISRNSNHGQTNNQERPNFLNNLDKVYANNFCRHKNAICKRRRHKTNAQIYKRNRSKVNLVYSKCLSRRKQQRCHEQKATVNVQKCTHNKVDHIYNKEEYQ